MLPSGTKCNEKRSQGTSPASSKRRMRSDVELLTKRLQEANEQAVELKPQLIRYINTCTSRRSSTEMQWRFEQSEEH